MLLVFLILLVGGRAWFQERSRLWRIVFLDVGQGDAILVQSPNDFTMLVDGGPDHTVLPEIGAIMPFFDRSIELVLLTHPDADHVTGLVEMLERYRVQRVIYTDVMHQSAVYNAFLSGLEKHAIQRHVVRSPEILKIDDALLEILWPQESFAGREITSVNDSSIVARLLIGDVAILLTGDIEREVEAQLLNGTQDLSAQLLKVPHHGSKTSSSLEFLEAIQPTFAVIQSGADNDFGHPHVSTLHFLKRIGARIFRTDELGRITFFTDGREIWSASCYPQIVCLDSFN